MVVVLRRAKGNQQGCGSGKRGCSLLHHKWHVVLGGRLLARGAILPVRLSQ